MTIIIIVIVVVVGNNMGRYSIVGIATHYGLDGPGIKSRWRRDFPHKSRLALGPPSLLFNGQQVFPRGYSGRGVVLTTNPHLAPRLRKE